MRAAAPVTLCAGTSILRWASADPSSTAAAEETLTATHTKRSVNNTAYTRAEMLWARIVDGNDGTAHTLQHSTSVQCSDHAHLMGLIRYNYLQLCHFLP
ncbi:hypothetical protein PGIGA_G00104620 [Pangasianodon gigas]|uniref:Uncharacterized protein n=1 Tax=Pangasianodon gigas TaxID=30993 RepID=A0ACC5W7L7_PANGG|nr:hypothetical protein [Pangasianodon gigas]